MTIDSTLCHIWAAKVWAKKMIAMMMVMLIVLKQALRTEGWRWRGTVEQTLEQKDWNQWNIFLIAGRIRWLQKKTVGKVFGSGSAEKS